MRTRAWSSYFVISKHLNYKQYYLTLLGRNGTSWQMSKLLLHDWTRTNFMFSWSRDWTIFGFYVKLFLPSVSNFVESWSIMSCIVLEFQLTFIKVVKESGVSIDGKVQGYWIRPRISANPQSKQFDVKTWRELCGTVDVWITVSFSTRLPVMWRVNILQNYQRNARFLAV